MNKIILIPPKPPENKKLRVAAYCWVSTLGSSQRRSLDWQIKSYTKMISDNPDWIFAGVFFDAGKSGLRRNGRTGLDTMLRKAVKGKIDYIITKFISRVSRDTLEILKIIRYLRERSINLHFENENLNSIRLNMEFEITLRSMLAQDESRNTSENIQRGFQRKFERGDILTKYKNFMGYTCVDGEIVIVPEQAEVVRMIFELFLQGLTFGQIKVYLESSEIKTTTSNDHWDTTTIQKMLKNEKYKADTMLQKSYTENFMTGKKVKNVGQRDRYYISNSHPAIVSDEVFDKAQEEMARRARLVHKEDGTMGSNTSKYNGKYLLGNFLVCGACGASYQRRTERGKVVWRCATRIEKGKETCLHSPTLDEAWIKKVLSKTVCENGYYDESVIRNKVGRIQILNSYNVICYKNEEQVKIPF